MWTAESKGRREKRGTEEDALGGYRTQETGLSERPTINIRNRGTSPQVLNGQTGFIVFTNKRPSGVLNFLLLFVD